jgi:hypothetical protein
VVPRQGIVLAAVFRIVPKVDIKFFLSDFGVQTYQVVGSAFVAHSIMAL